MWREEVVVAAPASATTPLDMVGGDFVWAVMAESRTPLLDSSPPPLFSISVGGAATTLPSFLLADIRLPFL
ncbi:hypothetical protein CRG98_035149 [Punica granatum]|uniref:Uncharacterized protein n=1 Tax=Punica granatum TaxID=22663 RepID=A0A2I0IKE0_PUNGR|nr:hypothetical protein CRG98_035149 [Punica granatum]